MIRTFVKKPVEIQACQINSADFDEMIDILKWCGGNPVDGNGHVIAIDTLEGTMFADPGDWIIKGVKGEFYPCKPDIFEASYEEVSDPS